MSYDPNKLKCQECENAGLCKKLTTGPDSIMEKLIQNIEKRIKASPEPKAPEAFFKAATILDSAVRVAIKHGAAIEELFIRRGEHKDEVVLFMDDFEVFNIRVIHGETGSAIQLHGQNFITKDETFRATVKSVGADATHTFTTKKEGSDG